MADIQPNVKTSAEAPAGALSRTDLIRIVQGLGTDDSPYGNFKLAFGDLADYIVALVSDATNDPTKVAISAQSGAYTYKPTDAGTVVRHTSATAVNATIDTNANQAFALTQVFTARQVGAGQVTFVAVTGVTLNIPTGFLAKTRTQGSAVMFHYVAANTWDVTGDLALA